MKTIGIREAKNNLSRLLKEIPFLITDHNIPIALVSEPPVGMGDSFQPAQDITQTKVIKTPEDIKTVIEPIVEKKNTTVHSEICQHKYGKGFCIFSWCYNARK